MFRASDTVRSLHTARVRSMMQSRNAPQPQDLAGVRRENARLRREIDELRRTLPGTTDRDRDPPRLRSHEQ